MEEIINSKKAKPARGFVTVQLFDEFGRIVQEEKIENKMTYLVTNRMKWRLRQDFYSGHPSSTLTEPVYPLDCIILDSTTDTTIYDTLLKNIGRIIGWSDKTNYSGTDTFRGTINAAESYTNNERVHYVFDWPTHAANGTFQTIAWGGVSGNAYRGITVSSISALGGSTSGLAWDGTNLWASDDNKKLIYKLNPSTGEVKSSFSSHTYNIRGLAWDGSNLWIIEISGSASIIHKLNPNNGEIVSSFTIPNSYLHGITWDGTNLWVADAKSDDRRDRIYKLNPATGDVINSLSSPAGKNTLGLAWDGTNLWVADEGSKRIYKLNPATGEVISSLSSPAGAPWGLTWDGTYLWASVPRYSSYYIDKIYKVDVAIGTITKLPNPVTKTSTNTMKIQYDFIFED